MKKNIMIKKKKKTLQPNTRKKEHDHNHNQQQEVLEELDGYDIMNLKSFAQHCMITTHSRIRHLLEYNHHNPHTHMTMLLNFQGVRGHGTFGHPYGLIAKP